MRLLGINARLLVQLLPWRRVVFEMFCWIQSEQQPQKRRQSLFERRYTEEKSVARIMACLLESELKGSYVVAQRSILFSFAAENVSEYPRDEFIEIKVNRRIDANRANQHSL